MATPHAKNNILILSYTKANSVPTQKEFVFIDSFFFLFRCFSRNITIYSQACMQLVWCSHITQIYLDIILKVRFMGNNIVGADMENNW